jgi:hypothetical protein
MGPAVVAALLPTAVDLLQEMGKTSFGKKVIGKTKKIMEVAVPVVKKASQVSIEFLATDIGEELLGQKKSIQLSKPLDIVDNGLSLPISYQENQFKKIDQKISDDLDIIKGQNEILFLSNSISYFIESHKTRTGIDRGISYALQYDIAAVCYHLSKHRELRFPGYLLHQLTSLSATITELNIFYVSILHDGHVPSFEEEEIKMDLMKGFGIDKRKGDFGTYVPYEMKMQILRSLPSDEKAKSGSLLTSLTSFKEKVLPKEVEAQFNDIAHSSLFILREELVSNEELEYQILKKIKMLPEKKLIVKSHTESIPPQAME